MQLDWKDVVQNMFHQFPGEGEANAKQIKTQKKNTCVARYENTTWSQCHQTKWLQEVTEK